MRTIIIASSVGIALTFILCPQASAWTGPVSIAIAPDGAETAVPHIVAGAGGDFHVVRMQKPEWRIYYLHKSADGQWGDNYVLGTDFCNGRSTMISSML